MKNRITELKWAVVFFATALLWMFLERLAGLHSTHIDKHMIYTNLFAIPAIVVYVFALLDKRKRDYGGQMSYKQSFISGLIITLIVTILNPLTQYLISTVITPDFFRNAIKHAVNAGEMTRSEAGSYYTLKNYIIQGFIGTPVMGIFITAVVSFFVRKGN